MPIARLRAKKGTPGYKKINKQQDALKKPVAASFKTKPAKKTVKKTAKRKSLKDTLGLKALGNVKKTIGAKALKVTKAKPKSKGDLTKAERAKVLKRVKGMKVMTYKSSKKAAAAAMAARNKKAVAASKKIDKQQAALKVAKAKDKATTKAAAAAKKAHTHAAKVSKAATVKAKQLDKAYVSDKARLSDAGTAKARQPKMGSAYKVDPTKQVKLAGAFGKAQKSEGASPKKQRAVPMQAGKKLYKAGRKERGRGIHATTKAEHAKIFDLSDRQ